MHLVSEALHLERLDVVRLGDETYPLTPTIRALALRVVLSLGQ